MPAGSRCHGTIINCEYVERGTPVIYLESKHRTDITGASVQHDPPYTVAPSTVALKSPR